MNLGFDPHEDTEPRDDGSIATPAASDAVVCGPIWVSPDEMCEVRVRGRRVQMSMRLLRMLTCLLTAQGRIVSREELYERSGGGTLPRSSRTVDVQMTHIRKALGTLGRYIIAVPDRGYRIDVFGLTRAR